MLPLTSYHHTALSVRSVDASSEWYCHLFGFEEEFRSESDDRRLVVLSTPDPPLMVGLVEHRGGEGTFDPKNLGLDTLAFNVESREALEAWETRLTDEGVTHGGLLEAPFGGMLNFKDPDGIALALFWERDD